MKLYEMTPKNIERATDRLLNHLWDHLTVAEQQGYWSAFDAGGDLAAYLYLFQLKDSNEYGVWCPTCIVNRDETERKSGVTISINRVVPDRGLCAPCEAKAARVIEVHPLQMYLELECVYV